MKLLLTILLFIVTLSGQVVIEADSLQTSTGTSFVVTADSDMSIGDMVIMLIVKDGAGNITADADFTTLRNRQVKSTHNTAELYFGYYTYAGETNWTFSNPDSEFWIAQHIAVSGASEIVLIDSSINSDTTTPTAPGGAYTDIEDGSIGFAFIVGDRGRVVTCLDADYPNDIVLTASLGGVSDGVTMGWTYDNGVSGSETLPDCDFLYTFADEQSLMTFIVEASVATRRIFITER